MPPWYKALDKWLLENGWPALTLAALAVIAVTAYLLWQRKAVPLAAWLTYLFMP